MKKSTQNRVLGVTVLALCLFAALLAPITTGNAEEPIHTVVLDAGHGGEDGGAVAGDGTLEKDLNLTIALRLKEKLETENITVIMTRTTDDDTDGLSGFHKRKDLEARANLGNNSQADLYVSIHINASRSAKDRGFQIWYGKGNAEGEVAATQICEHVANRNICTRIRAVKQVPETLYIFRTVKIPSLLVECGFLSNNEDLQKLKGEEHQNALCDAICEGIVCYFAGINSEIM